MHVKFQWERTGLRTRSRSWELPIPIDAGQASHQPSCIRRNYPQMGDGLPISLAEVAAPVQSCSYESIPTCTCTCLCRHELRCVRRDRTRGSDDTCIRHILTALVTSPPSAARYAPLDSQTRYKAVAREMRNKPCRCSHIISLRVPIISHRHTGKGAGRENDKKNFPIHPLVLYLSLSSFHFSFFSLAFLSFPKASKWDHKSGKKKKRRNNP
ncbi:hypothetical protein GGI35DRAFT_444375 [Trichoderma velutinum]